MAKKKYRRKSANQEYRRVSPYYCENCHHLVTIRPCHMCEINFRDELRQRRYELQRRLNDPFDKEIQALADRLYS